MTRSKDQSKDEQGCRVNLHTQTVFIGLSKQMLGSKEKQEGARSW